MEKVPANNKGIIIVNEFEDVLNIVLHSGIF